MKKKVLSILLALFAIATTAQAQGELVDITPKAFDFSKKKVGLLKPDGVYHGANIQVLPVDGNSAIPFSTLFETHGRRALFLVSGGQYSNPETSHAKNLLAGMAIVDLGGEVGKVLAISGHASAINGKMQELYPEWTGEIPLALGEFGWGNLNWTTDPDNTPISEDADAYNIRCRVVLNVFDNEPSESMDIAGPIYCSTATRNLRPTGANSVNARIKSGEFIERDEDGDPVLDDDDNYVWDPTKWMVYEFDTNVTDEEAIPTRIKWEMQTGAMVNATIFIKEVKFFKNPNPVDKEGAAARKSFITLNIDPENIDTRLLLNETNFPDANFRAALAEKLGIGEGDEITNEMVAATTELNVSNKSISDLTGIENFTALTTLSCYNNQLTALDLSKNKSLTSLTGYSNQLTSLNVSQNINLSSLNIYGNRLNMLDVSKNAALTSLDCRWNRLTLLDVSQNTELVGLFCEHNQLTALDVSENTALKTLYCSDNPLTSLDVSQNTELVTLHFWGCNQLVSLDVSGCTKLEKLMGYRTQLTTIDVSKNTALTSLDCRWGKLTDLDVLKNSELKTFLCSGNELTSLDVSQNTALTELYCDDNQLTSLDVSQNTMLTGLYCYENKLTSLDVSKNTALTTFFCHRNLIKGSEMDALVASLPTVQSGKFYVIDTTDESEGNVCTKSQVAVAKEKGWTVYDYSGGNYPYPEYEGSEDVATGLLLNAENFPDANFRAALASKLGIGEGDEITDEMIAATTSIDVNGWGKAENEKIADLTGIEHFTALTNLYCGDNQLTSLDVSKNTALTTLYCYYNQLTSLDVSQNTALKYLKCGSNQLTSLDVSKNTALTWLECYYNQLTSLDVSKNTALETLWCFNNQLTSLDVSKNTTLKHLQCDVNQLTLLDVSKNTALEYLYCDHNQLTSLDVSKNTVLKYLGCDHNQLTSLDVSKNTELKELWCKGNIIKGEAMDVLVASLPTVESGEFYVIDTKDENEGNVCTKSQVAVAKEKGWTVYAWSGSWQEYEGSDDTPTDIDRPTPDPSLNGGESWYTIDGVKLNGEPTQKGVYIVKGKKVKK